MGSSRATIKDWQKIIAVIDRTFTRHEKRLADLREETITYMRHQLEEASLTTHSTLLPAPEESSAPLPPHR